MSTDIYSELHENGIFHYGSDEQITFEKRLTRYFEREYKRYKGNNLQDLSINHGPLALAPKDLASRHYDVDLGFFQSFLDHETMSYTMAYYDEDPDEVFRSDKTLSEAQLDKFKLIASRMKLKGNERLLNIGCGFGYFESYLLNTYPELQVSSTTHSKVQYDYLVNRIKSSTDTLSPERFQLYFGEFDDGFSKELGYQKYDIVCSLGLLEQINNVELFFELISKLLVHDGRMFHHLIVSRDLIPQLLDASLTLIGQYFPGGKIRPFNAINKNFNHFTLLDSWFINGINYWKTIDAWHANFWRNLAGIYPDMLDIEKVRYWNNYFTLSKSMFYPEHGYAYGNGQYLYQKV